MPGRSSTESRTESRARIEILDGLRGVAIVLVVLSHGWILWPTDWIDDSEVARAFFRSGNFAVTIFLFAAGFFTYRALAGRTGERNRIGVGFARRVLRVAPMTLVVLPVIVLVGAFDDTDTTTSHTNATSIYYILTYRWNWYLHTDLAEARWDLGHLWYLSVDMQAFVLVAGLIYLFRRQPWGLLAALSGLFTLCTWWRMHVAQEEDLLLVLLRTTTRMDAFIAGVILALGLALMKKYDVHVPRRRLDLAGASGLVGIMALLWYCSHDERYLHWGVTLLEIALALAVGAVVLGAQEFRLLAHPALTLLGRNSLPLYVWHYPVFAAVQRNTLDWAWGWRAGTAIAITIALSVASHYLIEKRVSRLLAHPMWRARGARVASPDADREHVA